MKKGKSPVEFTGKEVKDMAKGKKAPPFLKKAKGAGPKAKKC